MLGIVVDRPALARTRAAAISQHDGGVGAALEQKSVGPPLVRLDADEGLLGVVPDTRVRARGQSLGGDAVALGALRACRCAVVHEDLGSFNGDAQSVARAVVGWAVAVHRDGGDGESGGGLLRADEAVEAGEVEVSEPGVGGPGGDEDSVAVAFSGPEARAGA